MLEKTFILDLGKIDYWGRGRKVNRVTVEITFRFKFAPSVRAKIFIVGYIWNGRETDTVESGQIVDSIRPMLREKGLEILGTIWDDWHLKYLPIELCKELVDIIQRYAMTPN